MFMESQLSSCCTARGSSKGFSWFSHTKVEAHKSLLLTESLSYVEKKVKLFNRKYLNKRFNSSLDCLLWDLIELENQV